MLFHRVLIFLSSVNEHVNFAEGLKSPSTLAPSPSPGMIVQQKKLPSAMSMRLLGQGHGLSDDSAFVAPEHSATGGVSSKAGATRTSGKRRVSTEAVIVHAVEEEIDKAISARKALHPDKWAGLLNNSSSEEEKDSADVGGEGRIDREPGGGKASRPSNAGANGGNASVAGAGKGGGFAAPPLSGGSSSRAASGLKNKRSSVGSSTKKGGMTANGEFYDVGVVGSEVEVVLTKKEKRALMEQQVSFRRKWGISICLSVVYL